MSAACWSAGRRKRTISSVAAILLAAGESLRWGAENKLLAPVGGLPMVRATAEAVLKSQVRPVLVVTGHDAKSVTAALAGLPVAFHHAADYAEGMAASLRAGVAALPEDCDGALICLGDMPFVKPETFDRIAVAFAPGTPAVIPMHDGQRGNPVLLGRLVFDAVLELQGDQGARAVLKALPVKMQVAVDDPGILRDLDQPGAL